MKAVVVSRAGGPEVLEVLERELPSIKPGWSLVKVMGFGINMDVQTLRFIQRCRSVEFSLEDIERLLKMWRSDGEHCADAKALADKHIALMECRIAEMQFMQNALREIVDQCAHGTSCALIDSMAERSAPPRVSPN